MSEGFRGDSAISSYRQYLDRGHMRLSQLNHIRGRRGGLINEELDIALRNSHIEKAGNLTVGDRVRQLGGQIIRIVNCAELVASVVVGNRGSTAEGKIDSGHRSSLAIAEG